MFMVEIDGIRVLYTGDYSTENERLINQHIISIGI
jgi:Cft2 family RNA processing exonuclease